MHFLFILLRRPGLGNSNSLWANRLNFLRSFIWRKKSTRCVLRKGNAAKGKRITITRHSAFVNQWADSPRRRSFDWVWIYVSRDLIFFVSLKANRITFFYLFPRKFSKKRTWGRKIFLRTFFFMKIQRKLVSVTVVGKRKKNLRNLGFFL